ncbi:Hsp70 family protein [Aureliella helgolandensis]|uniref:Chaperone protein DnaK n=1 Tax=Aureliella helgolandensis TaxID=2527968 RepID=A0A518FZX6_9BACT|nr:Hsp70 family protein [Aureliella helgolandensis]QDV21814.1 Chaperone protein DnaK [Aureliella helgolandensis]
MNRRYSIGIDLGTTNCVVAYASLEAEQPEIKVLKVQQISAPSQTESLESLPSFLYVPRDQELESGVFNLPDAPTYPVVSGVYARNMSADQPERTIAAAKSWLCHSGVDRHAAILPWESPQEVTKYSPVAAIRILLERLVDAWQAAFPGEPLREQLVTLTVPASFDMSARELTREAALAAGLPDDFILLEEPQAAVYHWLEKTGDGWRKAVSEGDSLLVCDVGGGTTDLTLVRVEQEGGELTLRRLAVGNHLLVGGDNMDLALAHFAAAKFAEKGTKLNAWQAVSLWHACRRAKESLLTLDGRETETVSVLGRGSKLVGGTVSIELNRQEVQQLLVEGFFPLVASDSRPVREPHSGFQELGLPFESDSGITRHISEFLANNATDSTGGFHLLLNGGVFRGVALRGRLKEAVEALRPEASSVTNLGGPEDLDHAVARGAAYYGWTKESGGVRIRGGTIRSYYVGIETAGLAIPGMPRPLQAVCVVPFGMEEGTEQDVPGREVGLVVGREAKFRFFAAANRKEDAVGTTLRQWDEEELVETSPMELTLDVDEAPEGGFIPVRFHSRISELGVFELWCKSAQDEQSWKLEFSIREDQDGAEAQVN